MIHAEEHSIKENRIYFVEFMRVFLILSVLLRHLAAEPFSLFFHDPKLFYLDFAVEFFFIIGGFFLYRNILHIEYVPHHIGKLWLRLAPCVIFGYLILLVLGIQYWGKFPYALSLTMRVGFGAPSVAGGPDWFVGVYFTVSCFLIALFKTARKTAWLWLIVIMFFLWCIQVRVVPVDASYAPGELYFSFLSRPIVRGITCMGLGIVAAKLSECFELVRRVNVLLRICATLVETVVLFMSFCFMYNRTLVNFNQTATEIAFAILLISTAHGAGYISAFFNRYHWIQYISRYVYSFFIMHGTVIAIFKHYRNFGFDKPTSVYIYLLSVIFFTLIEYHLIEKRVVPFIWRWAKKHVRYTLVKDVK